MKKVGMIVAALLVAAGPRLSAADLPADLDLVPRDAAAFVTVDVAGVMKSDVGKQLSQALRKNAPEVVAELEKTLGVLLTDVERLTIVPAPSVLIVRTAKPYDRAKLLKALAPEAREQTHKGKTFHANARTAVYLADAQVYLTGRPRDVQRLFDLPAPKDSKGTLSDSLALATKNHHVVASVSPRRLLTEMFEPADAFDRIEHKLTPAVPKEVEKSKEDPIKRPPEEPFADGCGDDKRSDKDWLSELPPEALPYKPLLQARSAILVLDLGAETKLEVRLACADEQQAKDGETAVRTALYVLRELLGRMPGELSLEPAESKPILALIKQLQEALQAAAVERKGTTVSATLRTKIDPAAVAAVSLQMQRHAEMVRSANNLKQIGLAMHNYESANAHLPMPAIYSRDGKPLLSWRVAILPYIEQDNLSRQFKLDEPWDSPHNIKLLPLMPKIYAPVRGKTKEPHSTYYQVFVGRLTPFIGNQKVGLGRIPDGTSNTFMAVEAGEAVPWTKPEDLPYDAQVWNDRTKPLPKLGGLFPDGFHVLMCDGSVHFLKRDVDELTLRRLIMAADGEVIDWEKLFRRDRSPRREPPPPSATPLKKDELFPSK
jgi:hypothetical protein